MTHLGIETWGTRIHACVLEEEILRTMDAYLGQWRPPEVKRLPLALTAPIRSSDELHARAIDLVRAETNFRGTNRDWLLLSELALVITAAAARARLLELTALETPATRSFRRASGRI